MKMKTFFLMLFCICFANTFAQKPVSFVEEYIDFELNDEYFRVNGVYYFVNNTGDTINKAIRFPFASTLSSVHHIRVFNLSYGQHINHQPQKSSVSFHFPMQPHDTVCLNIAYDQDLEQKNTYILRSTQTWGEPLKEAVYSLKVEGDNRIEAFSYQPDSTDQNMYYWKKKQFYPEKDFICEIKVASTD